MHQRREYRASDLVLVASATPGQPPSLGDRVILNSGGLEMLVVDLDQGMVTAAWDGGEIIVPSACLCVRRG